MSFEVSQAPESIQDVLKSSTEIVNHDFDYEKFVQAFAPTKALPKLSSQNSINMRGATYSNNDALKSCPPLRQQQAFTFDELNISSKAHHPYGGRPESEGRVGEFMNETNIRKAMTEMVKNGVNLNAPILKLQITGNPDYDLVVNDILNIFSRYGKVVRIEICKHRTAFIVYSDIMNALLAQKTLNNQYVRNLDVKLYVSWSNEIEEDLLLREEDARAPICMSPKGLSTNEYPSFSRNSSQSLPNLDAALPTFPYNPTKFTCKYEIQIENDKDFKIARKIIGPKGCNMKKIIEICQQRHKQHSSAFQSDFLKLRLRGRGSGFKEGPDQRESDDPLHLCVSSKFADVYQLSCKLVEDLLSGLYKEYEVFCQRNGRPLSEPVQIKRIEIYNGNNDKPLVQESKLPVMKSRQSSFGNMPLAYSKSLILDRHSESPTNSHSGLSEVMTNISPNRNEIVGSIEDTDLKASP